MTKILIYIGHPAQYMFLRKTIKVLRSRGKDIKILIKSKDILEQLLINDNESYHNILTKKRGLSTISIIISLLKRIYKIFYHALKFRPDLMIGTDASIAILSRFFSIHSITIIEDDYKVIKMLGDLTYPFTETILCPSVCNVGKWHYKKVGYNGFMKLAYLHPNIFHKQDDIIEKYNLPSQFSIIRLSQLAAYHDKGIDGLDHNFLNKIIKVVQSYSISVFITSESEIDNAYVKYLLDINPSDLHQVLAQSTILISDSQSMSVEASLLGVPSVRISSFVGKISVLEELEHRYKLTFGIHPKNYKEIIDKINLILSTKNVKTIFSKRKSQLLKEKIDVNSFLLWFIEKYPNSIKNTKVDSNYILSFE